MIAIDTSVLPNAVWDTMKPIEHPISRQPKKEAIKEIYKEMKALSKKIAWHKRPFRATMKKAKKEYYDMIKNEKWFSNALYSASVQLEENKEIEIGIYHISFKRHDRSDDGKIPWQHKQWIKNDICGVEAEGVELFPAESRILNTANQYHLWVLADNKPMPFGLNFGQPVVIKQTGKMESGANQTYQER